MRISTVAGNWKMNCTRNEALALATEIKGILTAEIRGDVRVILAPPSIHISSVNQIVLDTGIKIAAQNCHHERSGAFTGEISASMVSSAGAEYVIIGHSERRRYNNENDELLAIKVNTVLSERLQVIFCIGEELEHREKDMQYEVVRSQLEKGLFTVDGVNAGNTIIAYEPVWAIGTGKTASSEQAQEMHGYIRSLLTDKYGKTEEFTILYGGSCNEQNSAELFSQPDIDGGLIGGASLKSRSFVDIVRSVP